MIDILLPIYKPNQKIYEAINSVLAQTLSNWHLYIIDDASKDNSLTKIKENYSAYSDKITFFQFEKNQRAAACRNFAAKQGTGEFITFIDQDDVWLPDKLEMQLNYMHYTNADVVHGNLQFIDTSNKVIMHDKWERENESRRQVDWDNLSKHELACQIFMKPNIRIISSMVKRELFEKINGFKQQFFGGEDAVFWFEIALVGEIHFIDEILFLRRMHSSNTVDLYKIERLKGYTEAITYLRKNHSFLKKGIYNDKFSRKLNSVAKHKIKKKQYFCGLIYILKCFIRNPFYLFRYLPKQLAKKILVNLGWRGSL